MSASKRARAPRDIPALHRTQLCVHGPRHDMQDCLFAHRLSELRPPDESVTLYPKVWRHVDRFYGQTLSQDQMERFGMYWAAAEWWDMPLWAIALVLLEGRQECILGMAYPWDFGLQQDQSMLRMLRRQDELPFDSYPALWDRLLGRRQTMSCGHIAWNRLWVKHCLDVYPRESRGAGGSGTAPSSIYVDAWDDEDDTTNPI